MVDAFGLRFVYLWCSKIKFFNAKQQKPNSTGIPSKSQRKCDHRPSKNMLRRSAQNQLRFSSDFGPFWPPFWSPLGIILEPLGPQGPPCAAKGASKAPPGIPLGPRVDQGTPKVPPAPPWPPKRPLWHRFWRLRASVWHVCGLPTSNCSCALCTLLCILKL